MNPEGCICRYEHQSDPMCKWKPAEPQGDAPLPGQTARIIAEINTTSKDLNSLGYGIFAARLERLASELAAASDRTMSLVVAAEQRDQGTVPQLIQIKLASIVVHAQELLSFDGREADRQALMPLVNDPEIVEWLNGFDKALLPLKRQRAEKGQP